MSHLAADSPLDPPAGRVDAQAHAPLTSTSGSVAAGCPLTQDVIESPVADNLACPVGPAATPVQLSSADRFIRKLLLVRTPPQDLSDARVYRTFERSMLISAIRCTLTYVVFPVASSSLSFVHGLGPVFGIAIGLFALGCDTFTVRRFFVANHRYRWYFSALAGGVMVLLAWLLVQDIFHLLGW